MRSFICMKRDNRNWRVAGGAQHQSADFSKDSTTGIVCEKFRSGLTFLRMSTLLRCARLPALQRNGSQKASLALADTKELCVSPRNAHLTSLVLRGGHCNKLVQTDYRHFQGLCMSPSVHIIVVCELMDTLRHHSLKNVLFFQYLNQ